MENADKTSGSPELNDLRERIKARYDTYHLFNKERFPVIDYNTSRANYAPLRASFEEEFFNRRRIDRTNNHLHIPSTHTLAQIFTNDTYAPGPKILNTCRSYADGQSQVVAPPPAPPTEPVKPAPVSGFRPLWLVSFVVFSGLAIYLLIKYITRNTTPTGLRMLTPYHGQTVPRVVRVAGNVLNADTVWLVVHPVGWNKPYDPPTGWPKYFLQLPIRVDGNGQWQGHIYIGSTDREDIGVRSQIRAFVRPETSFTRTDSEGEHVFTAWPKADLSTEAIEVVRGPQTE